MPASNASHPLGPAVVSGNEITVDTMLKQPTRITRMLSDMTLQKFIADRIFASRGGVTGGAVIYDQQTANELYAARDAERVNPGQEFPLITGERPVPKIAPVEKWGGKTFITDEARDRNDSVHFTNELRRLGNTIVRKINQRAIAELEASITASGQSIAGNDWGAVITGGSSMSNASAFPAADFAKIHREAQIDELGVDIDLWLLNPAQDAQLRIIYGPAYKDVLAAHGIDVYVSNRVTAGTAYAVASQMVGEMRVEKPLGTETWREEKNERTWVQASVRPVMFITNPFSVFKVTGL